MSNIAWLDTSPDEERQMRELVKLFSDNGTLDDIGIGQVRDALTDQLFPATSTVHTRAKYFLLVPWIYEEAARKYTGTLARTKARDAERRLIAAMQLAGQSSGLIGRVAGPGVTTLPSSLYWAALKRLNIRHDDPQGVGWNVRRAVRALIEPVQRTIGQPGVLDGRDAVLVAGAAAVPKSEILDLTLHDVGGEGRQSKTVGIGEPQLRGGVRAFLSNDHTHSGRPCREVDETGGVDDPGAVADLLGVVDGDTHALSGASARAATFASVSPNPMGYDTPLLFSQVRYL